jgi:hypothetical protein
LGTRPVLPDGWIFLQRHNSNAPDLLRQRKPAVAYHFYPTGGLRRWQDNRGDGIGNLPGGILIVICEINLEDVIQLEGEYNQEMRRTIFEERTEIQSWERCE